MLHKEQWNTAAPSGVRPSRSTPSSPLKPFPRVKSDPSHVTHKVPVGDTPYVKAKRVQLVDKDPERAIALFWAAINAGDRVDSALKDMAIVMKQQNRTEEAIEAIKSLRSRCSDQSQESLDNILLDLYKRCGRLDDQIALLKQKLLLIHQGLAFNGKRTKTARSQGRKFQVSIEQEATRLLGNLGWALMQKENYVEAETAYRKALMIGPDNNKMCNLGICLLKQGRVDEANETLKLVRPAIPGDGMRCADSHLKAFDRAQEMLCDLESKMGMTPIGGGGGWISKAGFLDAFVGSSSIWKPRPCIDHAIVRDENNNLSFRNALNIDAPPFYSMNSIKFFKDHRSQIERLRFYGNDGLGSLKRTRSGTTMMQNPVMYQGKTEAAQEGDKWPELPEEDEFQRAIVAAVLAPVLEGNNCGPAEGKMGKRLKIFRDITHNLSFANA